MASSTGTRTRPSPVELHKPRMRGWLHAYAFGVAVIGGIVLCAVAATRPGPGPFVSCLVYSITVCALFGTSALYHRRAWSRRMYPIMRRLDHSMIFIFIAGTYTPFSVLVMSRDNATIVLSVVWGGAVAGVVLKLVWPHAPRWLSAPLYVALGWVAIAFLPAIQRGGGMIVLALIAAGGAFYTLGAAFYATRRPNPWPDVFGHHEFFHACTLVAALCHHIAVYFALFV
jgi:hemolysin III